MHLPVLAQTFTDDLFKYYLDQLMTPEGLVAAILMLAVPVALIMVDQVKWALLSLLIYISTYSLGRGEMTPLPGFFGQLASISLPLAGALFLFMAIPTVRPVQWQRRSTVHPATPMLFLFQLVVAIRQMSAGFATRGIGSIVINGLMLLLLGIGIGRSIGDIRHIRSLYRAVSWAAALMIFGSLVLLVFNQAAAMSGGRLFGTTANPQRLGGMLALTVPFSCALLMDRSTFPWSRAMHGIIASLSLLLVLGTGSRMGVLMSIVGLVMFFRTRIGPALVGGLILGAFLLVGYQILGESLGGGIERAAVTTDTRSHVWSDLFDQFLQSPMAGTPAEGALGECSYLAVAAGYGLIGLFPMFLFLFLLISGTVQAWRYRSRLGQYGLVSDLVVASISQFLIAWLIEAFLLGNFTDNMIVLYCTLGALGFVRDQIRQLKAGGKAPSAADYEGQPHDAIEEPRHAAVA